MTEMPIRSATRVRSAAAAFLLAAIGTGCPPAHPPGPRGSECDDLADCNAATCGSLVPCVRGFCLSDAPPVRVHCADAGTDASLYECDYFTECNDEACGEDLVPCLGGRCHPEAPRLDVPCDPECADDLECVVARHYDRCCGACPTVMPRTEVVLDPCLYMADAIPPVPGPADCYTECGACRTCEDVPVGAECSGATCGPILGAFCDEEFTPGERRIPASEAAALPPAVGSFVTIFGTVFQGSPPECEDVSCNPGPHCVAPILLDGAVVVRGTNCGEAVECSDYVVGGPETACPDPGDLTCRPLSEGTAYDVTGTWRQDPKGAYLEFQSAQPI